MDYIKYVNFKAFKSIPRWALFALLENLYEIEIKH